MLSWGNINSRCWSKPLNIDEERRETHLTWRVFLPVVTIMKSQYCLSSGTRMTTISRSWGKSQIGRQIQEDFFATFSPLRMSTSSSRSKTPLSPLPCKKKSMMLVKVGMQMIFAGSKTFPANPGSIYFTSATTNADETIQCPHFVHLELSWILFPWRWFPPFVNLEFPPLLQRQQSAWFFCPLSL